MTYRTGAQRWLGAIAAAATLSLGALDAAAQKAPSVQPFQAEVTFECWAGCPPEVVSDLYIVPASKLLIIEYASAAGADRGRRISVFFQVNDGPRHYLNALEPTPWIPTSNGGITFVEGPGSVGQAVRIYAVAGSTVRTGIVHREGSNQPNGDFLTEVSVMGQVVNN